MGSDQEYVDEMLSFFVRAYATARVWALSEARVTFQTLLQSSWVLQNVILRSPVRTGSTYMVFIKTFDTPTSFALYTSDPFFCWREAVFRAKLELDSLITKELDPGCDTNGRERPLLLANWTKGAIQRLFEHSIIPS